MVAQAAIAALPLIEPVARGALQLAQTPILGWERVQTYTKGRKRPVSVVERSSFTLRAWELALGAGIAYFIVAGTVARQRGLELPGNLQDIFEFFFP